MKFFKDKVVVITGAGSGIGHATAAAFAREGSRLHLTDIRPERLLWVEHQLKQLGVFVRTYVVDSTDAEAMQELAEAVYQDEARVDILHNNAGVCCGGPVERIELSDWRWVIDVNLWGVIHGIRAFVPRMIAQGGGSHIINTASMAGLVGFPFVTPYCASKFAVVGLSESLAAELSVHDIRVTVVCPGMVRTRVLSDGRIHLPGDWDERIKRVFDSRAASPEKTAHDILRAVRKKRSLQPTAGGKMIPLWILKRTSITLYHHLARLLTRRALRA